MGLAGDMLSDLLIPMLDSHRPGQVDAYESALGRPEQDLRTARM